MPTLSFLGLFKGLFISGSAGAIKLGGSLDGNRNY